MTADPKAEAKCDDGTKAAEATQATALVSFVRDRCEVFHDADKNVYAKVNDNGEIHRLESRAFKDWMLAGFYKAEGKSARDQSVREAVATLGGVGRYDGEQREVHIRVAHHEATYYLDLGIPGDNRAVRITPGAWEIVSNPPVMFVRPDSMRPLPVPVRDGEINRLFTCVNVPTDHRLLVIAWLIDSLRTNTPFPVLEIIGEAGSAKSTTQQVLRRLIDPNGCELRAMPKTVEDLWVGAGMTHVVSMENISHLPAQMQDALCTLATGGGFARRKLYTDSDESIINVKRPVMLNGISVSVTAQDLVDRCISIDLPLIVERVEADALLERFDREHPRILGGLLDTFAAALARLPNVHLPADQRPRLVEFAKLGCAVAEVMGRAGSAFMEDFNSSRTDAVHRTLDASPAAAALVEWFDARGRREASLSVKELHAEVSRLKPHGAEGWPKSDKGFADCLRRAAPALRQIGIDCRSLGKQGGVVRWCIRGKRSDPRPESPASPDSVPGDAQDQQDIRTFRTSLPEISLGNAEVF